MTPGPSPNAAISSPLVPIIGAPAASPGSGIGLIGDAGGAIVGHVRGPAGLVSDQGGGVIGNNGGRIVSDQGSGYRLLAAGEIPFAGISVALQHADGTPLVDAKGTRISGVTQADGSYRLPYTGSEKHLVIAATLPAGRGTMLALLPRGAITDIAPVAIELDLASTLTMGYILGRYVQTQPDPLSVLERLPPALEAETRGIVATAAATTAPPSVLTSSAIVDVVERLRSQSEKVDAQLVTVRQVLLAGLSDQGAGQAADAIEMDGVDLALSPNGELVYAASASARIWKKDAAGRVVPIAGSGFAPPVAPVALDAPAPGDGGAATAAALVPDAITYMADGTLLIVDRFFKRIRQMDRNGILTTRVSHADWDVLRDVAVAPDGGLVVATHSALWRVPPGGQPVLLAGDVRPFDAKTWLTTKPTGEGGKPANARFGSIMAIAQDPRNSDVYVMDVAAAVFRIGPDVVERVAGTAISGFSGDGGPAALAKIGALGGITVRADGSLVIADAINHRLREVTAGTITTIAGTGVPTLVGDGGPALAAGVLQPIAPVRAADGTLYFLDQGYIRQVAQGLIHTHLGGTRGFDSPRPAGEVQLLGPLDLRYEASTHSMWVTDVRHVWRWNLAENRLVSVFGGGAKGATFGEGQAARETHLYLPRSILHEGNDRWSLLATDPITFAGRVLRVTGGALTTLAGGVLAAGQADTDGPALGATMSAVESNLLALGGWYYYTIAQNGRIRRFQPGGQVEGWGGYGTATSDGTLAKNFNFNRLTTMAGGPDGQIYVGDVDAIYRIDPVTTMVTRIAGKENGTTADGGLAHDAAVSYAGGFAWDAAGHLYFSEPLRALVRRIRKDTGIIERVAGAGTSNLVGTTIDTGLSSPVGLAFDKNDDLYIADQRHGQIKVVPKAQRSP